MTLKTEKHTGALIAMSGGVDSSVAVYLMKSAGYDCAGVTMRLFDPPADSGDDAADARAVADRLSIPHTVCDLRDTFREAVVESFVRGYKEGGTPNPCVFCNRCLKFGELLNLAEREGFACLATGHYARVTFDESTHRYRLWKAADPKKDQSYVLYMLTQKQLSMVRFPLGELTKEEVRRIAEEQGFVSAHKKDSQDICFVPDGDYAGFIRRFTGKDYPAGDFVTEDGQVLGRHKGLIGYTVGQRRGLGLSLPAPLYVFRKDPDTNRVILTENERLYCRRLVAENGSFTFLSSPGEGWETIPAFRCAARIRYNQTEAPAAVTPLPGGRMEVVFDEPQRAVTKGQAVVLYDGDEVLGGATITEGFPE